jgi:superfamily I DNA and RNA helicase
MQARERLFVRLTTEQAGILDHLDEQQQALINGPAGSGKTMMAYELARRIAAKGEDVLFLCSPKMLRKHLNDTARRHAKEQSQGRRITFAIPRGYAFDYLNSITTYPFAVNKADGAMAEAKVLQALYQGQRRISNVVIDEGQDFTDAWIEGLRKCTTGKFFVFYDRNQALFQDELPRWFQKAPCKLGLTKICRNTREIATTAFRFIAQSPQMSPLVPSGARPKLHLHSRMEDGREILSDILLGYLSDDKAGIGPEDIAVLTMRTEATSLLKGYKWPAVWSAESHLRAICFTSSARFKGLERRIVIIVDVDFARVGDKKYRGYMHLGCTRAVHELHIIAVRPDVRDVWMAVDALGGQSTPGGDVSELADLLVVDVVQRQKQVVREQRGAGTALRQRSGVKLVPSKN